MKEVIKMRGGMKKCTSKSALNGINRDRIKDKCQRIPSNGIHKIKSPPTFYTGDRQQVGAWRVKNPSWLAGLEQFKMIGSLTGLPVIRLGQ